MYWHKGGIYVQKTSVLKSLIAKTEIYSGKLLLRVDKASSSMKTSSVHYEFGSVSKENNASIFRLEELSKIPTSKNKAVSSLFFFVICLTPHFCSGMYSVKQHGK
jgi:hypothetical protein